MNLSYSQITRAAKVPLHIRAQAELLLRQRNKSVPDLNNVDSEAIEKAKSGLLEFTLFTKPDYIVNWHHKILCNYLDKFWKKEIINLMIFMPPQHGKTELASRRFPAFLLGHEPREHIIFGTHTDIYAKRVNREVQRIMSNPDYNLIFPDTLLPSHKDLNYSRTTNYFDIINFHGSYKSTSVEGAVTGNPATTLILDDPYKGPAVARSDTKREHIWDWYYFDFLARKSHQDARTMIIQTRWHEDDIAGRQLKESLTGEWVILSFPAICEDEKNNEDPRQTGEALWPEKFSIEYFEGRKQKGGSYWFASVYQQRPQPEGGGLFKRKYFKYCSEDQSYYNLHDVAGKEINILKTDCQVFSTMDLAVKATETSDYTVFLTFALTPNKDIIVLDVYRVRVEGSEHMNILWEMYQRWHPSIIGIEAVQYQTQLVQQGLKKGYRVKELKPGGQDKFTRALPISARMESGHVYFMSGAHWLDEFERELLSFPNGKHKDQVDAFAYTEYMLEPEKEWFYPLGNMQQSPPARNLPQQREKVFKKSSIKDLII